MKRDDFNQVFSCFLAIAIALIFVVACAGCATTQAPVDNDAEVTVSGRVREVCEAEGGCMLLTKEALDSRIEAAFTTGFLAGAAKAAEKMRPGL